MTFNARLFFSLAAGDGSPASDPDTGPSKMTYSSPKFRRRPAPAKPKPSAKNKKVESAKSKVHGGKKREKIVGNIQESTTSGTENEEHKLGVERPIMVEGKKYVRHPEDDATFLVSYNYCSIQI